MFLDLIDVLRSPGERVEKPIDLAPAQLGDIELAAPIKGFIRAENARRNLVVRGRAKTAIEVPCSRCLKPSVQEMDLELEAVAPIAFFRAAGFGAPPTQPIFSSGETPPVEDEESEPNDELAALFEGHTLDVLELVRQSIELQMPIAPLCSPDCEGLPGTEQYFEVPDDGRWSALEKWASEGGVKSRNNGSHNTNNEVAE